MAKINKKLTVHFSSRPDSDCQKVVVLCLSSTVAQGIAKHLEKRGLRVWIAGDEKTFFELLDEADPQLVFLDASRPLKSPLENIVENVFLWMRKRAKNINQALGSPSHQLWQHAKIIIFESGREITASGSLGADIADMDFLIRKCSLRGEVYHIGVYSPLHFMATIRPLLEKSSER